MSNLFNDGVMEERYRQLEDKYLKLREMIHELITDAEDLPVISDTLIIRGYDDGEATKVESFVKNAIEIDNYVNETIAKCENALEEGNK